MTRTWLVTGGAGFIGSALVRRLLGDPTHDVRVVNVDKLTYAGHLASLGPVADDPRHHFHRVDICDAPALAELFSRYRPDGVFHLAAESHVDRSIDAPAAFIQTNLVGTFTVLQEARRYFDALGDALGDTFDAAGAAARRDAFRVVHVSTDEVFGALTLDTDARFDEASPYRPSSPYSASKAGADHLARAWHHTFGLPVIVTSSTNNYGPYHLPDKLIPLTLQRALAAQPIPVYGDGLHVRDWLHVDDHARALTRVMTHGRPGETYAIGAGQEHANLTLVHQICAILDDLRPDPAGPYARLVTHVADRPGHDRRYALDPSKLQRDLGWAPEIDFAAGLEATVRWFLANADWVRTVTKDRP